MRAGIRNGLIMATVLGTAGLAIGPASAGAAPVKAKGAETLALHCTKLGDLEVILKGNGTWTPGHVVGSTRILKPYELHITGTFTPTGGAPQSISQDSVKPAPKSRKLDECSFHQERTNSEGSFSIDGTAKVQYSGKRLP
jgi:hypothetical protein